MASYEYSSTSFITHVRRCASGSSASAVSTASSRERASATRSGASSAGASTSSSVTSSWNRRARMRSMHFRLRMRMSHALTRAPSWSVSSWFQAVMNVSCTTSSSSSVEPRVRRA
jgi:hypothetical protein